MYVVKGCHEYQLEKVMDTLREGLDGLGGIDSFCKRGDKVLLKVNLLLGKDPHKAITTHPVVVEAVCRILLEVGAQVTIGDSPGGPFIKRRLKRIYEITGLTQVAERTGVALNENCDSYEYSFKGGEVIKQVTLGEYVKSPDLIINLPKLKTHSLTGMTAGVKNLFGVVPGLEKVEFHLRFQEVELFSHFLLDLALAINPPLNILDAIISMEGKGPSWGTPRRTGFLVLAKDPFILDLVAGKLLGFSYAQVSTNELALKRGLVPNWHELEKELPLSTYGVKDFTPSPATGNLRSWSLKRLPFQLGPFLVNLLRPSPQIKPSLCKGCGDCKENCPPGAITILKGKPSIDLQVCIRCFCCHELCPYGAVDIKRSFFGSRLFGN